MYDILYISDIMTTNCEKICAGEWMVLQRENFVKVHKIGENAVAMLGRDCVELNNLIGQPKWSTYHLEEKNRKCRKFSLKKCDSLQFDENVADSLVDEMPDDSKDNRFIKDDGQSQKLSKEEIEEMQSEGASAKEIIGQLVENSLTFDQKSAYAQEKYVHKKQRKYKRAILVRPTSIRLIVQALIGPSCDVNKILGLRIDSLSQLVYMSGVQSGAGPTTFLLFESGCQGLVTAAVLERIGDDSESHLIVLGPSKGTNKAIAIQAMNFPPSQLSKVYHVSLAGLLSKAKEAGLIHTNSTSSEITATDSKIEQTSVVPETSKFQEYKQNCGMDQTPENTVTEILASCYKENSSEDTVKLHKRPLESPTNAPHAKRSLTMEEIDLRKSIELLQASKANSLIIVGKENPTEIVEALLPLVASSSPVVLFSQFREPLQETYMRLKTMRNVTALRLSEPWLRNYQVLSERTHPEVTMSSSGGYLLTGLSVDPS